MSRLTNVVLALSASSIAMIGLQAVPAHAATTTSSPALLEGQLGVHGAAFPGGFEPTSGSVNVEFYSQPLVETQRVGTSGHFKISLAAGKYTVIGCGPPQPAISAASRKPSP